MLKTQQFACEFEAYGPIDPDTTFSYDRIWGPQAKLTLKGWLAFRVINSFIKANAVTKAGVYRIIVTPGLLRTRSTLHYPK